MSHTTVQVGQSFPLNTADGWGVSTFNAAGVPFSLTVIAICGDLSLGGPTPVPSLRVPDLR